ncbi:MAG TPA: DUF3631 domain-containing protein [Terriglobia bacterium]|nr:DUF3631 domain-containing protein [Terriglobia bacterium]
MVFFLRFVRLTMAQARAVALWIIHAHAVDAADCTPYLSINSAEKESGKTRLLEVMRLLVLREWFTSRVSAAVLVRKIHAVAPSLLLDESDAAFSSDKEYAEALRGVLNSGYWRGGCASLCVGQGANLTYQDFSTFSPKAIAGIGKLPDTVASRAIPIRLKRAPKGQVQRFRERLVAREAAELNAKIAAWAGKNIDALRDALPEIPDNLTDRQADCCEPLLAIADLAGGDWPEKSRKALVELCVGAHADDRSIGVMLLGDIKRIFYPEDDDGNPLPKLERIASADLVKALHEMENRPWPEFGKQKKPITPPQIDTFSPATTLAQKHSGCRMNAGSRVMSMTSLGRRGRCTYRPIRLLPLPYPRLHNVTTRIDIERNGDFGTVTPEACHAAENGVSLNKDAPCHAVTDENRGTGERKHESRGTNSGPTARRRG